jgi:hypothetical protein
VWVGVWTSADVDSENWTGKNWGGEDWRLRLGHELKRLGRGAREDGREVDTSNPISSLPRPPTSPTLTIFTGGRMPLNRSLNVDSSAFPKSFAPSTVKTNPTRVL